MPSSAFFTGRSLTTSSSRIRQPRAAARSRVVLVEAKGKKVLIVNTKKGGHAFLGLYLAKRLMGRGMNVTIMNDGDASLEAKAPFSQYPVVSKNNPPPRGLKVFYGSPADPSTYPSGTFDVVVDNNGKSLAECQPLIDKYAKEVQQYCFIASAGAFQANSTEPMHVEGDARKASAGHVQVEQYLERVGAPYTVFHPLYMYGAFTAKDCEQWFMDRISRGRPVPIPAPGVQLTSISHVEDVAALVAAAVGNPAAIGQHYNASGDRTVTLDGAAQLVANALGTEANIVHYNPKDFDIPKGKGFPFRAVHFFASTDKAKRDLGWYPQHSLPEDMAEQARLYKEEGRDTKPVDFTVDDMILAGAR